VIDSADDVNLRRSPPLLAGQGLVPAGIVEARRNQPTSISTGIFINGQNWPSIGSLDQEGDDMKALSAATLASRLTTLTAAVLLASSLSVLAQQNNNNQGQNNNNQGQNNNFHGAPGPIIGAGLPILAVGYGVYWLIRRRRRTN
jgi:hypothetical protein